MESKHTTSNDEAIMEWPRAKDAKTVTGQKEKKSTH